MGDATREEGIRKASGSLVVDEAHLLQHGRLARFTRAQEEHLDLVPHRRAVPLELLLDLGIACWSVTWLCLGALGTPPVGTQGDTYGQPQPGLRRIERNPSCGSLLLLI